MEPTPALLEVECEICTAMGIDHMVTGVGSRSVWVCNVCVYNTEMSAVSGLLDHLGVLFGVGVQALIISVMKDNNCCFMLRLFSADYSCPLRYN